MKFIERKLDGLTMYRVVLYGLATISCTALVLSVAGVLSVSPVALVLSFVVGHLAVVLAHTLCVRVFRMPGNIESSLITAGILFLVVNPVSTVSGLIAVAGISAGAIFLKYIVRYHMRHLFNPVALALVLAGLAGYYGVGWWVGSRYLLPVVIVAGLLVAKKTRRLPVVLVYVLVSAVTVSLWFVDTVPVSETLIRHFISWPTIFFATFMLTEPLGLPSTKNRQYVYAGIAGVLGAIPFSFGILHGTPELALLGANLFTFVVDRPKRLRLTLTRKREVGTRTVEYSFAPSAPLRFVPGQYMEWTLMHTTPDARGIRRYFTISSAPSDEEVSFAVRHVEKTSTWKAVLAALPVGGVLYATQRSGDFMLRSRTPHHVLIAGGIGVTPFISMIRDACARQVAIPATLFYCNKTQDDVAFLDEVTEGLPEGMKTVHVLETLTGNEFVHETGFVTEELVKRHVPAWNEATYYISGPPPLVNAYKKLLRDMGISQFRIVTDYFPGLA